MGGNISDLGKYLLNGSEFDDTVKKKLRDE